MSDDEDSIVAIDDVLESADDEKAIVMGGIENRTLCSFIKGYMKRQAIYTCRTCLDITGTQAGFCYPCSINCHDGHDLVELYTKRNFRCDCGNGKFRNVCKCILWEEKDDENVNNSYNHNFANLYCTCSRPYPDEDYEGEEEMVQCGVCEDWFHIEHLNIHGIHKSSDEYDEMTCFQCIKQYPFIAMYAMECCEEPITNTLKSTHLNETPNKRRKIDCSTMDTESCQLQLLANKFGFYGVNFAADKWFDIGVAMTSDLPSVFWTKQWRNILCKCLSCKAMYEQLNLSFLLDPEDSMVHYLKVGKERAVEMDQEEDAALSEALSTLPRPVMINVATGINRLKKALEEFLSKKRDQGHVVTAAEVRAFFQDLRDHADEL